MSIAVHIYPLSRLVHASPRNWETQIRQMEEGKILKYRYYSPLREAAVAFCSTGGKEIDLILKKLNAASMRISANQGANPVKDNRTAFDTFVTSFYPRIQAFGRSFLSGGGEKGVSFGDLALSGMPHFSVTDQKGRERFVYLHPSKCDDDDLKAYLELLSVVVRDRFESGPESIWCMDLKTGKDFKWKASSRMMTKCRGTADHYARLIRAMKTPG